MAEKKRKPGRPPGSKNKKTAKNASRSKGTMDLNVRDEICAVLLIAVGIFLAIAIQTTAAGAVGEGLAHLFKGFFGAIAFVIPYYLIGYGILLIAKKMIHVGTKSVVLLCVILLMVTLVNSARFIVPNSLGVSLADLVQFYNDGILLKSGGVLGMYIGSLITKAFGIPGLYLISIVIIIISLLLIVNTPISRFIESGLERRNERIQLREERRQEMQEQQVQLEMQQLELMQKKEAPLLEIQSEVEEKKKRFRFLDRLKENNIQDDAEKSSLEKEIVPEPPKNVRPDLSKLNITKNQRNILEYMYEDDLFGERETVSENGLTGLQDDEVIHMAAPEKEIEGFTEADEIYNDLESFDGFTEREELYDLHTAPEVESYEQCYEEDVEDEQMTFVQAESEIVEQEVQKITNSQAAKAALDPGEINENAKPVKEYKFPPVKLLNKSSNPKTKGSVSATLQAKARKLEETLHNFNIDAEVVNVTQGPAITRYEIHPNVGVKVKSIVSLADDIALNLEAKSIRIEAPIPGKAAVGIEVENDKVNMVTIRDIIDTNEFRDAKSKITFSVGKDIAGNAIVADLKGMPHLLVAGATGSGKSVCVNSIITSILYKARPDEVKFVLIDPKVVELTNYNGIPHLLIPVVTEPTKAAAALNWAVAEMEDRYKKFAAEGVRELSAYNDKILRSGEEDKKLPQVVIIIDELADLMMAAPSQVEDSICRLAQKARAAGMHLIVATQRPSVDVITGVIKANIPSRIAFAVSSQFDSRTILDMAGAEKLVGKGDMLLKVNGGKPVRVQGTFISDDEVNDVINFVKGQIEEATYANEVMDNIDKIGTAQAPDDADELLPDAIETVVLAGQASASMLQRRFRVGYNRAARMIDQMEARGIIGPSEGSKPRQVLMTEEELHELDEATENLD